jgi:polyisoprenyl-teichoic acid--peptidoglycan teichoic acid transferase
MENQPTTKLPPSKKAPRRGLIALRVTITTLVLFVALGSAGLAYGYSYYYTHIQQPFSKFERPVSRSSAEPTPIPTPNDGAIMGRSWNILLLGSDNDSKYNFPAVLTQVMMVVHIDPIHNSVYMVSIPRDSWVYVPEDGAMHKIDQAFFIAASQNNNFDDGVRAARLTVEKDYGITIDRYAWVGLSGFASVIDTLGGVDIDLTHPIVDDNYPDDTDTNTNDPYALQRLYLAPGPQHLDGQEALEYVRSRHADLIGDIGRTVRQQQLLTALEKKLNVVSILSNLPQLISDLTGKVYTDMSEQELLAFANYARTLNSSAIHHVTFGPGPGNQDYGDFGELYDPWAGSVQSVVIPHCENIQPVINSIFGLGNVQSCNVNGPS